VAGPASRWGFTLAEVLITLGVIGVVAAITMPVISANIQKNILKNQFKKTYSNIQNVYDLILAEKGSEYECYYHINRSETDSVYGTSECREYVNDFLNKFNVIDICKEDCIPDYKTGTEILAEGGNQKHGASCSYLDNNNINGYVISDGSILYTESANFRLIFDINGIKPPNKFGYDVFVLNVIKDGTKLPKLIDEWCTIKEKGGFFPSEILYNK